MVAELKDGAANGISAAANKRLLIYKGIGTGRNRHHDGLIANQAGNRSFALSLTLVTWLSSNSDQITMSKDSMASL
jgi:hypothetical protein